MAASDSLSPAQFPKPFEIRDIGGVPHQFRGVHFSDEKNFKVDPNHEHALNIGNAPSGGVYATHMPSRWDRQGAHAHEIWSNRILSREDGDGFDETITRASDVHVGARHTPESAKENLRGTDKGSFNVKRLLDPGPVFKYDSRAKKGREYMRRAVK